MIRYNAFHWSLFTSGCIFLGVGIIAGLFCNEGLIFFIFAFPTFLWVGVLPLLVGTLCILQALLHRKIISIEQADNSVVLRWRKWRKVTKSYPRMEIRYVSLQYHEAKTHRWLIVLLLLIYLTEVLFRNGISLLGAAPLAPFLLLNALLTTIGVAIFVAFPRRLLEIGTQKEFTTIPCPPRKINETTRNNLLACFGVDPASVQGTKTFHSIRENLGEDFSTFILALVLLLVGLILVLVPAWFYGQFTGPLALALGVKNLLRILKGGRYYVPKGGSTLLGLSSELTFFHGTIESLERRDAVSLSNLHSLELLGYFYLISQGIKYGFRFVWWPYMGFNPVYSTIGITLIALIFVKLFIPAHQIRCQLSGFPLVLRTILSTCQESVAGRVSPIIVKIRDFLTSFRAHKGEKTFLWVVVFFIITVVAPAVYFAFGGHSLFL